MRQEPKNSTSNPTYLIIGNGKLARHFIQYFSLLGVSFSHWTRSHGEGRLQNLLSKPKTLFLCISDGAIQQFIESISPADFPSHHSFIHFSGCLTINNCFGYHPLCSFSDRMFLLGEYQKIPFIGEEGAPPLKSLVPEWSCNPFFTISRGLKPLYHSYCVIAGNFTSILWKEIAQRMEGNLKLPHSVLQPYLDSIFKNLKNDLMKSLTGPLARNDLKTIQSNIDSLKSDSLQQIYMSFVNFYFNQKQLDETKLSHPLPERIQYESP